ncbi:MAG: SOS response-associated peptidase family protein, partial [Lachnospiraceae bacterium]|nr:SOS response-associated peptidase family protein [Lachnospiraceae bacterium]
KEANESMRPVHDRMPMLLTPEEVRRWLAPGEDGLALLGAESPVLAAHREYEQMRLF